MTPPALRLARIIRAWRSGIALYVLADEIPSWSYVPRFGEAGQA